MRILICGDRHWNNPEVIQDKLAEHKGEIECVIEGEAPGADAQARDAARACGIEVHGFPAEWDLYGKAAGPMRNKRMLEEGRPTHVWAFHNNITQSRGTRDMLRRAIRAGLPCVLFNHLGESVNFYVD